MLSSLILWVVDEQVHRAREREARVSYIRWIQGKVRKAEKEEHGDSCERAMIEKLNLP